MSMFFSKRAKLTFDSVSHGHWSMAWLHPCSACQPGIPRNKHPFIDIYLYIYIYICVWFYILFHHVSSIYHLSMILQRSLISLKSKTLDNNNNHLWSSTTFSWFIRTTFFPCGDSLQTSRNSPWTRCWQPGNFAMSCAPSALAALWPGQPEEK